LYAGIPILICKYHGKQTETQDVLMSTGIIENPEAPADSQHYKNETLKQSSGTLLPH
jgi:hypothetical protein